MLVKLWKSLKIHYKQCRIIAQYNSRRSQVEVILCTFIQWGRNISLGIIVFSQISDVTPTLKVYFYLF